MKLHNALKRAITVGQLLCASIMLPSALVSDAVAKGEPSVVPIQEESVGGKNFSVAHMVIHARPEQVWRVLSDYGNVAAVFPQLKKCEILEDHGKTKLVKHTLQPTGVPGRYEYVAELREEAPRSLELHRVSGSFKEVDSFWKLEPIENGKATLVTYSNHINGGILIPQALIKRQFRLDMPAALTSLRSQTETSSVQIAGKPGSVRDQ